MKFINEKKCLLNGGHFCSGTLANDITCDYFLRGYLNAKMLKINHIPFIHRLFILHSEKKKADP